MIYIVVLNWNSDKSTIQCIESLMQLTKKHEITILVCDNNSSDSSYQNIDRYLNNNYESNFITMDEERIKFYQREMGENIFLIKNNKNYGYAGGNNIGIRFALNQKDMTYVWVLNNDTVVTENSLFELIQKIESNKKIGICGSRLVSLENKKIVQGIGGKISPWSCMTVEVGNQYTINDEIDEEYWQKQIDYVIGASLFFSREFLEKVGLLCEDYFLYYEEVDICNRAKYAGYEIGIASKSIVFHEQGVSTGQSGSSIANYYSIRNRILIAKKYYSNYIITVKLRILLLILKRGFFLDFKSVKKYIRFLII